MEQNVDFFGPLRFWDWFYSDHCSDPQAFNTSESVSALFQRSFGAAWHWEGGMEPDGCFKTPHLFDTIWVNYSNSLTCIKAIKGDDFPY